MTERDFQQAVIELAHLGGWKVAHFRPALTKHGWRTPVSADGAGFPDLVLAKAGQIIFRELKAAKGKLTPDQIAWGETLHLAGADWAVWRPDMLDQIAEELTGRSVRSVA